jgi:hypothetical protein
MLGVLLIQVNNGDALMQKLNVMIWNDSSVKNNNVECIVSIDMYDVGLLVCAELQRRTGKKYQHCEVRGLTSDAIEFDGIDSVVMGEVAL